MRVLVTGGAGFLGSHTSISLAEAGHEVVILDNFCNSSPMVLDRLEQILGRRLPLAAVDVRDTEAVSRLLKLHGVQVVIHFAALKAIAESVSDPLGYYENNVSGTLSLLRSMVDARVHRLVFSSSATVYDTSAPMPVHEGSPVAPANPYGQGKLVVERIIKDVCDARPEFSAFVLRYFNPAGAHPSGLIGEHPHGVPNNLLPYVTQVAAGRRSRLPVFGSDWPTRDGTGIRDYVHVSELADAHVRAVERLSGDSRGASIINLGTGRGTSVLEIVRAFEAASGRAIPFEILGRRSGDVAAVWADPTLAKNALGWTAKLGVERMCADAWRWQLANPEGFGPVSAPGGDQ